MSELNGHLDTSDLLNENEEERQRTLSFLGLLNAPRNSICNANTIHSVTSFRSDHVSRKSTARLFENPNLFARELSEKLSQPWIENTFEKRECVRFVAQPKDQQRCGCGRLLSAHSPLSQNRFYAFPRFKMEHDETWTIANNTQTSATDAFGTIVFQGGAHAHKAQYVRLSYDSDPLDVMYLMEKVWGLEAPRLVITVHGGMSNFELQERLGRLFRKGMLKAAQTTGAWIITSGLDSGVVRHVAKALDEAGISARMRSQIITIGIAPWGVIKRKERLLAKNEDIFYDVHSLSANANVGILNDRHSYFLLADNGTVGRFGADLYLRQNLENHIATYGCNGRKVPVVCTVLEGGISSINAVHDYVTMKPDIPAIVCDGSGRAADLISFAARYINNDGSFAIEVGQKLHNLIQMVFPDQDEEDIYRKIIECASRSDLLRIFRCGEEEEEDVDFVILSTVLQKQNLPPEEQLALTLSWNRVDLAKSCLFSNGKKWAVDVLKKVMNDALFLDRVDFVECLLENGVSMKQFLTINSLENLYNMDDINSPHCVRNWFVHYGSIMDSHTYLTIPMIGVVVEKLMGNAFQHYYTSRSFKSKYDQYKKLSQNTYFYRKKRFKDLYKKKNEDLTEEEIKNGDYAFSYPFNDLLIWAVLTRRHDMAKCMWIHGEDAMAKCLVAIRLYKATAKIAEDEYLEVEEAKELFENALKCRENAIELMDQCYRNDHDRTLRLLRMELPHWGNHNCLSLAVLANTKAFLAHPCCQILLAELWHGSLKVRSGSNIRVLSALVFPPAVLKMAFKPKALRIDEPEDSIKNDLGRTNSVVSATSMCVNNRAKIEQHNSAEELKDLLETGGAFPKKVTIVSSRKNSGGASVYGSSSSMMFKREPRLTKFEKFQAFYSAPITKFWSWCIAFLMFLTSQTFILLIETPLVPTKYEWITCIYVVTLSIEHMRKLLTSDGSRIQEKIKVFYAKWYNIWTSAAMIFFLIGYAFRLHPAYRHSIGRVLLSCSNVLFYMKTFEYLSVHPLLGPYIQMAAKMVWSMCYIVVLLLVTLMAFGVSRQAITFPHSKWNWLLVRNIFYKPYFMLYGEVYAGEIDTCGDEGTNCVPGGFIPPFLMVVFLLVANILLLNLLIAIFNNIYNDLIERSKEIWLFQRYGQLMEYHDSPFLPPPFSIIAYFVQFSIDLYNLKTKQKTNQKMKSEHSIKLIVSEDEMKKMQDFEEDCIDTLTRIRRVRQDDRELLNTTDLMELTCQRVQDLMQENFSMKGRIYDLETKINLINHTSEEIVYLLKSRGKLSDHFVSTISLPQTSIEVPKLLKPTCDNFLSPNNADERLASRSPLMANLHRDHTLRKYDDANFPVSKLQRRPRLHSSSCSVSQDMKDMKTSKSCRNLQLSSGTTSSHEGYDTDVSQ